MEKTRLERAGAALLEWHARTERDLPWKGESDPYRVWVSETMLQQTRAAHAAARYEAFLARFPDVNALAEAPEEDVLALWQGMGYYARARNMRRAAAVVSAGGGRFPDDEEGLLRLPGVGEYTAGAVLSMAFGRPVAAIDANLTRALSRFFALRGFAEDNRGEIRALGEGWLRLCAAGRPGDFNRALMGLGALVCLPRAPKCGECPVAAECAALALGLSDALPDRRPKAARGEAFLGLALALRGGLALARKRPERGMLASLWEFPHFPFGPDGATREGTLRALAQAGYVCESLPGAPMETDFTFTHRVWHIRAWRFSLSGGAEPEAPYRLADARALAALPMPSVMEPYRRAILSKM